MAPNHSITTTHPIMRFPKSVFFAFLAVITAASALANDAVKPESLPAGEHIYVIERTIPGAGKLTPDELKAISQKSCGVLQDLGPEIRWLHSYVTGDKIYCVYVARSEEMVREHAKRGGFPADSVSAVKTIISPKTAE